VKLQAQLDDTAAAGGYFVLTWEHGGQVFPYQGHMDFGVDVLGHWTIAMRELLRGADRVELRYVEGGHALTVSRVIDDECVVLPAGVDPAVSWPTTVRALATTVLHAGEFVCQNTTDAGELARDLHALRELLAGTTETQ
jgi:hypothetical protein